MAEEAVETKKSGKGLLIVLIVLVLLLLIGIGVMTMLLMGGGSSSNETSSQVQEEVASAPGFKVYKAPAEGTPPQYFEMKFVVNFIGEGKAKHLAADMKFMSRYPEVIEDLANYEPFLKDAITRLLRRQTYSGLNEDMGDDKLRTELLTIAKEIAEQNRIDPDLIENVFLTRLVTQ